MVCKVKTSAEILLIYSTHLVMTANKILAADTQHKCAKNCPSWNVQLKFVPPHMV
jgi:hypothetical protein